MTDSSLDHYERSIADEVSVEFDGSCSLTIRGMAKLCGVDHSTLVRQFQGGDFTPSKLVQILTHFGFEPGDFAVSGIPDTAIGLIVDYYANKAGKRCTNMAKATAQTFLAYGVRTWMQRVKGWQPGESKPHLPVWHQRLMAFYKVRPVLSDRFCTFEWTNQLVVIPLETNGYVVADRLMPDASVGWHFRIFLLDHGYDLDDSDVRVRYNLDIPLVDVPGGWQTVQPWQYTRDLFPLFHNFLNDVWLPEYSIPYFKKRDKTALPAVGRILGLPEQLNFLEGLA